MLHRKYRLELTLEGPVLSQAVGTLGFGLDAAMQRYDDRPALNGAQIRGNLRHVLRKFQHREFMPYLDDWFPDEQPGGATRRSRLNFDLFWLPGCLPQHGGERVRIEIGEQGAVKTGSLQVIEDLFPSGSLVTFGGIIRARFGDETEQERFEKWMDKALQWLDAVGSLKGVGYGRLAGHRLIPLADAGNDTQLSFPENATRIGLRLTLDRPFCLGRQRSKSDNRIVSSDHIPGEVIKAILAERFNILYPGGDLADMGFDDLIVNHAHPVLAGASRPPGIMPLNVAVVGKKVSVITRLDENRKWKTAPAFQADWKPEHREHAEKALNIKPVQPNRLLLVRTAIDPATGTAKESALFSLECVEPSGHEWLTEIELSRLGEAQRAKALECLPRLIGNELDPIGKTGAVARVAVEPAFTPPATIADGQTCWQITLRTPARLLPNGFQPGNVNTDQDVRRQYQAYFDRVSGNSLELLDYFTTQRLHGGEYHYQRFQKQHGRSYQPEWHVQAGSVFILKAREGREPDARARIRQWARENLPACETGDAPAHWQHTPTLPEHGYGEIEVTPLRDQGGDQ